MVSLVACSETVGPGNRRAEGHIWSVDSQSVLAEGWSLHRPASEPCRVREEGNHMRAVLRGPVQLSGKTREPPATPEASRLVTIF